MKELELEFNLEQALRIQNKKEEGRIVNKFGNDVRIICTNAKGNFPIVGLVSAIDSPDNFELPCTFTKTGKHVTTPSDQDLILKIPIKQKQFDLKPFDKVLVRDNENDKWRINFFSNYETVPDHNEPFAKCAYSTWKECIPCNDDTKHLLGTTNPFKY